MNERPLQGCDKRQWNDWLGAVAADVPDGRRVSFLVLRCRKPPFRSRPN